MRRKVLQTIREYEMLRPGDRVTVGFSGGADSTALLYPVSYTHLTLPTKA